MEGCGERMILCVVFDSSIVAALVARESEAWCRAVIIHQSRYKTFSKH